MVAHEHARSEGEKRGSGSGTGDRLSSNRLHRRFATGTGAHRRFPAGTSDKSPRARSRDESARIHRTFSLSTTTFSSSGLDHRPEPGRRCSAYASADAASAPAHRLSKRRVSP